MSKSAVPNAFTLGNLAFGILSIMMTLQNKFILASIFIIVSALMDRYDGRVARFLNVSSEIGKELDSLADLVSFGVAPSILVFTLYNFINLGPICYILLLIFPIAGAYRLARYNISTFDGVFMGIPITVAGVFLAIFSLLSYHSMTTSRHPGSHVLTIIAILFIIVLSYLMVSKIQIKKV